MRLVISPEYWTVVELSSVDLIGMPADMSIQYLYNGTMRYELLYIETYKYFIYNICNTVFCPGFQKGRVPSEKGTLAR